MSEDSLLRGRALPSQDAVELLSDKWRITLLHLLTPGPQRAKTLQKAISRISPQSVVADPRDGLISRQKAVPQRSSSSGVPAYRDGRQRDRASQNACLWAQAHAEERDRARGEFDARKKSSEGC